MCSDTALRSKLIKDGVNTTLLNSVICFCFTKKFGMKMIGPDFVQ